MTDILYGDPGWKDVERPHACPREGDIPSFDGGWNAHALGMERKTVTVLSCGNGMATLGWDARAQVVKQLEAQEGSSQMDTLPGRAGDTREQLVTQEERQVDEQGDRVARLVGNLSAQEANAYTHIRLDKIMATIAEMRDAVEETKHYARRAKEGPRLEEEHCFGIDDHEAHRWRAWAHDGTDDYTYFWCKGGPRA